MAICRQAMMTTMMMMMMMIVREQSKSEQVFMFDHFQLLFTVNFFAFKSFMVTKIWLWGSKENQSLWPQVRKVKLFSSIPPNFGSLLFFTVFFMRASLNIVFTIWSFVLNNRPLLSVQPNQMKPYQLAFGDQLAVEICDLNLSANFGPKRLQN